MKNCSYICGVQTKNIILIAVAGIFISALGEYRNYGLPISRDFCTAKYGNVLGRTGDRYALFSYPYYNFSYAMTKNVKNCTGVQGAPKATSAHDTRESLYSKFLIEKNAKNKAYAFILSSGLLSEFAEFSCTYNGEADTIEGRIPLILKNC